MEQKQTEKWYFKTYILVLLFLTVGPFALPLFWFNPRYSKKSKVITSIIILVISYFLVIITLKSLKSIFTYYGLIFNNI